MRTRYLLCYDVRNDERLRRTAKVAEAFGDRLQYSVFICDLSDIERLDLERGIKRVINVAEDSAVLIDLGPPGGGSKRMRWISSPPASNNLEASVV